MKVLNQLYAANLLNQYCIAYNTRDLKGALQLFTKNANMWGTGIDEYRTGISEIETQLKRDWNQSEKGEIKLVSDIIGSPENPYWAAAVYSATIYIDGKPHIFEHLRATIAIAQEQGEWKISHMHASFPESQQAEGHSFPTVTELVENTSCSEL